jgi:hypothetical protein
MPDGANYSASPVTHSDDWNVGLMSQECSVQFILTDYTPRCLGNICLYV